MKRTFSVFLIALAAAGVVMIAQQANTLEVPVWVVGKGYIYPRLGPSFVINGQQIDVLQSPPIKFSDQETPAGTMDGANLTFTLANAPSPSLSLDLARNGSQQKDGFDYTLAGKTITFVLAAAPQPGDSLVARYRY